MGVVGGGGSVHRVGGVLVHEQSCVHKRTTPNSVSSLAVEKSTLPLVTRAIAGQLLK